MIVARAFALLGIAALLTAGCNQRREGAATLDAGADARARTAAKTLADVQAAEHASAGPLPRIPAERASRQTPDVAASPKASVADDVPDATAANQAASND